MNDESKEKKECDSKTTNGTPTETSVDTQTDLTQDESFDGFIKVIIILAYFLVLFISFIFFVRVFSVFNVIYVTCASTGAFALIGVFSKTLYKKIKSKLKEIQQASLDFYDRLCKISKVFKHMIFIIFLGFFLALGVQAVPGLSEISLELSDKVFAVIFRASSEEDHAENTDDETTSLQSDYFTTNKEIKYPPGVSYIINEQCESHSDFERMI